MSAVVTLRQRLGSTVAKEFAVAISGLGIMLYVLLHLVGNLAIFLGPEIYNGYAEALHALPLVLWPVRALLIAGFAVHIIAALSLARENSGARGQQYAVVRYRGDKSRATRLMTYTGIVILVFLLLHVYQFALSDHAGEASAINGEAMGIYGIAWNTFSDPIFALIYIVGVVAVGLHLSHAIASVLVTIGMLRDRSTAYVDLVARAGGMAIGVGFATIPVYVLIRSWLGEAPL